MSVSEVTIANLALQKLGAARINSFSDDSRNARSCNACYTVLRNKELRAHNWNFSIRRAQLAASTVTPLFFYSYAFPLPEDFLRLILPPRFNLDWKIERHENNRAILTNDGAGPVCIRYVSLVTDPNEFDEIFVEALACKLAWHMAEEITQSNEKKSDALREYTLCIREARQLNAFERISDDAADDSWLVARELGSRYFTTPMDTGCSIASVAASSSSGGGSGGGGGSSTTGALLTEDGGLFITEDGSTIIEETA